VIVLKDLSLQQLNNIIEFIYLGSVAIPEEDAGCFKSSLEALRISLDDLNQDDDTTHDDNDDEQDDEEEEEEEQQQEQQQDNDDDEEDEDIEVEEEIEPKSQEPKPELEIKTEPEWEHTAVVKEEPVEHETIRESQLRVSEVTHVPPQLASVVNSGTIRIRTPASINEKAAPQQQQQRVMKIVHKLPTMAAPTNIQELSKRLSKAILIRRVKKSDGSFVSERSPVKIIQGVKIQKVGQSGVLPQFIPMRPQVVQQRVAVMQGGEKRMVPVFRCSHCSKAFTVNKRRNAHEKYCFKNPSRPSSQCPYCPMVLCNPMYIGTHIKKVHGIDDNSMRSEDGME
jgi:hypothetical protein